MAYKIPKFGEPSTIDQVEAHVAAHHAITTRVIASDLGLTFPTVSMALNRLKAAGRVHRTGPEGERRVMWAAGPATDDDIDETPAWAGQPRQSIVKSWAPAPAPRDPLLWALYGGQP